MSSSQKWRRSKEYRLWRVAVIRKDKVCQACGSRKSRHAHHIECASYNKDLRYDVDNGTCLCRGCHTQLHINFYRSYRVKTDRYGLMNFLSLAKYMINVKDCND